MKICLTSIDQPLWKTFVLQTKNEKITSLNNTPVKNSKVNSFLVKWLHTLTVLLRNVGHFSSSAPFIAALPRNKSIEVPGGNNPWYCCHFKAWPRRAIKRDGGTTFTSPANANKKRKRIIKFNLRWHYHNIKLVFDIYLVTKIYHIHIQNKAMSRYTNLMCFNISSFS